MNTILHTLFIHLSGADESIWKAEIETQRYKTNVWTPRGEAGVEGTGRLGLTYMHTLYKINN